MIYTNVLEAIIVTIVCVSIVRMITQGIFFFFKFNQPFYKGVIPVVSSYRLHKTFGASKLHLLGSILRFGGFALMLGVLLWQYYDSLVQMTHMYGVLLHNYTPTSYNTAWILLSYAGLFIMVAGWIMRWLPTRRISPFFGMSGFVNVLGTIEPTLYYLWMTFSPKAVFILNKPTKQMSSAEYQMYCVLTEE